MYLSVINGLPFYPYGEMETATHIHSEIKNLPFFYPNFFQVRRDIGNFNVSGVFAVTPGEKREEYTLLVSGKDPHKINRSIIIDIGSSKPVF